MPSKRIFAYLKSNRTDSQQLSSDFDSLSSWQNQDISSNWRPGHYFQILSNLGVDFQSKMSGSLEGYHYINGPVQWDLKEGMSNHATHSSFNAVSSVELKNSQMSYSPTSNEAYLILQVPPENRFRYRYDTEMSGTHGSLQGIRTGREKSAPSVELVNYPFEALIRVSLVTCQDNEHYPHPHSLFVKEKLYQKKIYENWDNKRLTKTGHYSDPHYIRVGRVKNDFTARFEGMCIINSKKENFHSSVKEKMQMRCFESKHSSPIDDSMLADETENLIRRVELAVRAVDVDFVSLCFEAFKEENGKLIPICQPVYSEPIGNAKSAKTGKLKISRINKCSGSCRGGDEIWLLVEKINKKGLVVRFSEEYNGKIIWESCIEGDDLILHHQYAIIFKTPPYRDVNITSEVEVLMRLERTTQPNQPCDYSEPITFVYEPSRSKTSKGDNLYRKESILKQFQTKRPRTEPSPCSPFNHQSKRRTDDIELEGMDFNDSDDDIEQLLFDGKDSFELDQAWGKFNVEEFLRFISSDDVDMPMQKDGIAHNKYRRDFFYKLYLLYTKLDENDMKKLTEQISNFRVSKKENSEGKCVVEKDQVKDAASTLLTLRSKALINNNNINCHDDVSGIVNKTDISGRQSCNNKLESLIDPCCGPELEGQSPVHMSVIKYNLSKSNQVKDLNNDCMVNLSTLNEASPNCRIIKQEKSVPDCIFSSEKMESVFEILNKSGCWRNLAELWNIVDAIVPAKESSNPSRYIFEYLKQVQGGLEAETIKDSLDVINATQALEIFSSLLQESFDRKDFVV